MDLKKLVSSGVAPILSLFVCVFSSAVFAGEWREIFNGKNLEGWDTYIGPLYDTEKKDFAGPPIGLNKDPQNVFSVVQEDGEGLLRISGEQWGGISTQEEFSNYQLQLQFKWGESKFAPRDKDKRDSGLLYHATGEHGKDWHFWMRSLEMQIQEGDCGDYWGLAGVGVNIRATKNAAGDYHYNPAAKALAFSQQGELGRHVKKISNGNSEKPNGEWNTIDLYVFGDSSIHVVNGVVKLATSNAHIPNDHKITPLTKGKIQIQSEGAELYYKNIRIKKISELPKNL